MGQVWKVKVGISGFFIIRSFSDNKRYLGIEDAINAGETLYALRGWKRRGEEDVFKKISQKEKFRMIVKTKMRNGEVVCYRAYNRNGNYLFDSENSLYSVWEFSSTCFP